MRFATAQGFNNGDQFFGYLKDTFDVLYREGEAGRGGIMSVGLHCRLVGRPGRMAALERFLDYVGDHPDAWVTTRLDIARHWIAAHPPRGGYRPTRMGRALFGEVFGPVCAGLSGASPAAGAAMAERVRAGGLPAEADDLSGLARLLAEAAGVPADARGLRSRLEALTGE